MNDTEPAVQFGELPPDGRRERLSPYAAAAEALRAHPGDWGKIYTAKNRNGASSFAVNVRKGHHAAFRPPGSFESAGRGCDVWVRYVGGQS